MGYFQIGMLLSIILSVTVPYVVLKNRWGEDYLLEDLYDWWDGGADYDGDLVFFTMWVFFVFILINIAAYPLIVLGLVVYYIINKLRTKHINNLNKKQ